ncbi:hypothetical protein NPIL_693551, partial [Nephila pilipes]
MTKYFRILILAALTTLVLSEDTLEMFNRLQCNGTYDSAKFDPVLSVCEECNKYFSYHPVMHERCLVDCFTSRLYYFCYHWL